MEDWDAATKLWEYAITSRLTNPKSRNPMTNGLNEHKETEEEDAQAMEVDGVKKEEAEEHLLDDSPLLMTETGWNSGKNREKAIEVAMEEWGCPAFWLARNGVLAAYAAAHNNYSVPPLTNSPPVSPPASPQPS